MTTITEPRRGTPHHRLPGPAVGPPVHRAASVLTCSRSRSSSGSSAPPRQGEEPRRHRERGRWWCRVALMIVVPAEVPALVVRLQPPADRFVDAGRRLPGSDDRPLPVDRRGTVRPPRTRLPRRRAGPQPLAPAGEVAAGHPHYVVLLLPQHRCRRRGRSSPGSPSCSPAATREASSTSSRASLRWGCASTPTPSCSSPTATRRSPSPDRPRPHPRRTHEGRSSTPATARRICSRSVTSTVPRSTTTRSSSASTPQASTGASGTSWPAFPTPSASPVAVCAGRRTPCSGWMSPGIVEAVGSDVTRFQPGDEVFGIGKGTYAEYAPRSRAQARSQACEPLVRTGCGGRDLRADRPASAPRPR